MLIYLYLVCIEYSLLIKSCILWASYEINSNILLNEKENVIYLVTNPKKVFLILIYIYLVLTEYSILIKPVFSVLVMK